ncbi:5'/3'-nucleotidase SurE [Halorubrum lipolyticum]|uniref:5'-nucleotidase SurE n=1 Tax=Halorubrum lipolyticum DSM 21995 TaxID=1227482 RepID=M0P1C1_9EURY|nr:5'/3'-nucleotidase SurE [Halorubrum lipolyticum]EMA63942.1 Survival protein SurE [Halorubrum lipolyticum DSM 21995]
MSVERVLLTNDDGIDAAGLRALYDALDADYDVVAVAPTEDRSSAGRTLSEDVGIADHELGYAVDGTPVDCVVAGLDALIPDADVVVAGCNEGANLGAYTLGRSGTVSAAVEAAFFDVPAVATSMYVPGGEDWWKRELRSAEFANATRATRYLVAEATASGAFDRVDYLNVNAPIADADEGGEGDAPAPMRVTSPSPWYGMEAAHDGNGRVRFSDPIWGKMNAGDVPDPIGTDRRAVVDGEVSVSPLSVPHAAEPDAGLDELAAAYGRATENVR